MLGLTIATSLPRFTKVSKPLALAAEKLEMYSVVIVLIAMRFFSMPSIEPDGIAMLGHEPIVLAGIASIPLDAMLSIASAINIIVINTVKLAIEFLVWIIPIPAIDAVLEVINKSIATGLMALYAYSPLLATLLNLILFACCAMVFMKLQRRIRSTKELVLMPFLDRMFFSQSTSPSHFKGFLKNAWNGLPANSMIQFERADTASQTLTMTHRGWLKKRSWTGQLIDNECTAGLLSDQISVDVDSAKVFFGVRRGVGKGVGIGKLKQSDLPELKNLAGS